MKLKNVLIVVKDIERSKQFYHDLFRLFAVLPADFSPEMTQQLKEQGITTEMSALSGGVQYGILYELPDACEQSFAQEKQAGVYLFVRHGHRQLLKPDNLVRL